MGKETKRVIRLLENMSEKAARRLVIDIHRELVKDTPKDTGWAMNNWFPSISKPITETAGSPDDVSAGTAMMAGGIADILNWSFKKGPAWLSNNVPYIKRLNEGHSVQAAAGFVDKVIQNELSKAKRKK